MDTLGTLLEKTARQIIATENVYSVTRNALHLSKCVTSTLVIHSAIHCTRDLNSSLQISNYTKPAQISSQNDNLLIFGHLQALCSNIKVMKANNLCITAQSTNCENHMADQEIGRAHV